MMMRAYEMALDEVPTWAVEEAARRWNSGKSGPQRFAPSPPELRCLADEVVLITKGKIAALRRLAKIEVSMAFGDVPQETRNRMAAELLKAIDHADVGDKKTRTTAQGANAA